jgi:hypothetical protein
MRLRFSVAKAAWSFVSLSVILSAAFLAGCDSPSDPTSPIAQQNREELNSVVEQQEAQANKNSKGVVLKSIKGGMKIQPGAK